MRNVFAAEIKDFADEWLPLSLLRLRLLVINLHLTQRFVAGSKSYLNNKDV